MDWNRCNCLQLSQEIFLQTRCTSWNPVYYRWQHCNWGTWGESLSRILNVSFDWHLYTLTKITKKLPIDTQCSIRIVTPFIFYLIFCPFFFGFKRTCPPLLTLIRRRGGPNGPPGFSGTKGRIDLEPGCKFKFVRCLETYVKILVSLDHEGTLEGPFLSRVPWNLPRRVHFGVHAGPGGSLEPW